MSTTPHPRWMTPAQLDEARGRPAGSMRLDLKDGLGTAYLFTDARARPCADLYTGKSLRATSRYYYRSEARRAEHVAEFVARLRAAEDHRAAARAKRSAPHVLEVGDILRASWGYDQTNIDYYEVVRATSRSAWLRELAQDRNCTGDMRGTCVPLAGHYVGPEAMYRATEDYVKIKSYKFARRMTPTTTIGGAKIYAPDYWTAYA